MGEGHLFQDPLRARLTPGWDHEQLLWGLGGPRELGKGLGLQDQWQGVQRPLPPKDPEVTHTQ